MAPHVCPWWLGYAIDNKLRRLVHKPEKILRDRVREGMTVLDVGCGMGFFSIAMAKMVGESGRVIAVDIQEKLVRKTIARAARAGVGGRLYPLLCNPDSFRISGKVDFALCFWVLHEAPDPSNLLGRIAHSLKPGAGLLVAEPLIHVSRREFLRCMATAESEGLMLFSEPPVRFSHSALLLRQ